MKALTTDQVQDGFEKILKNAAALIDDAHLLFQANRPTRAYTLAHLAREELSKIRMLYRVGLSVFLGETIDWKDLWKRFTNHHTKLRNEAVFAASMIPYEVAPDDDQLIHLLVASASYRNDKKNRSLYVSFADDQFVDPASVVTAESAERTIKLAEIFWHDCSQYVKSFSKVIRQPVEEVRAHFRPAYEILNGDPAKVLPLTRLLMQTVQELLAKKHAEQPGEEANSETP